jgi:hypothetical protein
MEYLSSTIASLEDPWSIVPAHTQLWNHNFLLFLLCTKSTNSYLLCWSLVCIIPCSFLSFALCLHKIFNKSLYLKWILFSARTLTQYLQTYYSRRAFLSLLLVKQTDLQLNGLSILLWWYIEMIIKNGKGEASVAPFCTLILCITLSVSLSRIL